MNKLTRIMSEPERDRSMQVYLSQARGTVRNGDLLRQVVDRALQILAMRQKRKTANMTTDDLLIETLCEVVDTLETLNVEYAVTGSVASSVHGEPHSTVDADLVLIASMQQAGEIATRLTPRFYAPQDMLLESAQRHTLTNIVDNRTGLKVDLSFIGEDPFLHHVLDRRVRTRIGSHPYEFWFVTPEDIILMKLLWRIETKSHKQWDDALSVVQVKGVTLDWKYLFDQAQQLNIEEDLIKMRDEAGI